MGCILKEKKFFIDHITSKKTHSLNWLNVKCICPCLISSNHSGRVSPSPAAKKWLSVPLNHHELGQNCEECKWIWTTRNESPINKTTFISCWQGPEWPAIYTIHNIRVFPGSENRFGASCAGQRAKSIDHLYQELGLLFAVGLGGPTMDSCFIFRHN